MYDDDDSDEEVKRKVSQCPYTEYYYEGQKYFQARNVQAALLCFQTALGLQAKDKRTLIARSKCYLYLGDNEKALEDIEAALVGNENDTEVLYQKAQVLYMMGNFEFASVFFQRGMQLRPQLKKFQYGLQKAQYAIQNALGGNTRIKLSSHQIDRLRDKHQQAVRIRKFKEMAMGGKMKKPVISTGFDVSPTPSMVQHVTDKLKKTEESQLLELVSKDKMYCKELIGNRNLYPVDNLYGQRMAELADSVVRFLGVRQEFWRQQKPVNLTRTRREIVRKVHLKLRKTGGIVANLPFILRRMEDQVAYLNKAEREGDWHEVVTVCQRLQGILLPVSDVLWPKKAEFLCSIFSSMGRACLKLGLYERGLNCHKQSLDIATNKNLYREKEIALENLGNAYAYLNMYEKSIEIWQQWISRCPDPAINAWLLHEIGRCYVFLNDPLEARKMGRQGVQAARAARQEAWILGNLVLVAECEVKLGNFKIALDLMGQAVRLASKLNLSTLIVLLDGVRAKMDNLVGEANITLDGTEMTLFEIAEEEKEGLFPKELTTELRNLKYVKRDVAPDVGEETARIKSDASITSLDPTSASTTESLSVSEENYEYEGEEEEELTGMSEEIEVVLEEDASPE